MLRPRDNYSRVEVRAINYYNLRSDPKLSHRPCHVFNRPAGRKNPVETIRNYPTAPSMFLVVLDVEIIPSKLSGQILDTDVTSGALPIHAYGPRRPQDIKARGGWGIEFRFGTPWNLLFWLPFHPQALGRIST